MNLRELREWPTEIDDLAAATRAAATNHTNSADFYRALAHASSWEGDGADAARASMMTCAGDHDVAAENLVTAAIGMGRAQEQSELVANQIKSILDDAAASPYPVEIDQDTNQVIPPNTDYLTDEAAAEVAAKVTALQERIAAVLAAGQLVDSDLAQAIRTATEAGGTAATPAPGQIGAFAVPPSVAAAKPADDAPKSPDSLDSALEQVTGRPVPASATDPAGAAAPVRLDPAKVEQFKAQVRQVMQRSGVPADQIEARLDAMVAAARQPLPPYTPLKPDKIPAPGYGDGFADTWFGTEQLIKDLTGQEGFEEFKESWAGLAEGLHETVTNPVGAAVGEVKHALDSPSLAYYLGEKSPDAAAAALGGIFGGEAALAARAGALDDLAGTGSIPHNVIDPGAHQLPAAADHLTPGLTDNPVLAGHGPTGADDLRFEVGNPIDVSRPEFNLANPLDHLSPELLRLSEQHLTGSGETVLGPYAPRGGGPSYIEVAQQHGASYFDIGDAWYTSTPTQQLAANQHVLDVAISNGDTIRMSVPFYRIDPASFTGAEIRYLEAQGYQRVGDNRLVPPTKETP